LLPGDAPFGLAVSGGPDSLALLLLAHPTFPCRFEVATVDHGLRPESADEAAMVAHVCAERGIAHATLRPEVARKGNLQANARVARYAALGEWAGERGLAAIVTAHHRDDQAETLLMRLNRGAGVRGLAGMRGASIVPAHPELPLLRPLLGWTRAELVEIVATSRISPADDPSNRDRRFERVAVRQALAQADWLDPPSLAASAGHLAEADEALEWAASREWDERVERRADGFAYRQSAPRVVRLRVLERIISELGREGTPRGNEIARMDTSLSQGKTATLAGVRASADGAAWNFVPAPARRSA
jgi:tRNA(Ile)-lysidine synthase